MGKIERPSDEVMAKIEVEGTDEITDVIFTHGEHECAVSSDGYFRLNDEETTITEIREMIHIGEYLLQESLKEFFSQDD